MIRDIYDNPTAEPTATSDARLRRASRAQLYDVSASISVATLGVGGDAGVQQVVTDPRGIVSKTDVDLMDWATKSIAAVYTGNNGAPAANQNQTTALTYDGDGDILTQTALMPSGTNNQTTAYIYGIGSSPGSTRDT